MQEVINACRRENIDLSSATNLFRRNTLYCYFASFMVVEKEGVQLLLDYGVRPSELDTNGASALCLYESQSWETTEPEIYKLLKKQ